MIQCPVCKKLIDIKDKLIAEHQNNDERCYGSFMPEYEAEKPKNTITFNNLSIPKFVRRIKNV